MSEHIYTILVIDDELITRTTLAALLEKPNYHVEMAEDGIQGIEMAKQLNPDVILLDVMMPRMNGYDVCKRIRSDPQIAEVPIIMVTTEAEKSRVIEAIKAGVNNYVVKPFTAETLGEKIQQTLSKLGIAV